MRKIAIFSIGIFLLFAGCSGNGNPTMPDRQSGTPPNISSSIDNLPLIDLSLNDGSFNALGMLGAYELTLNPGKMTAELVSKRIPSVGESFIVNGKTFFTVSPCSTCLKIKSVSITADNYLNLTFYIRHPFEPGDPLLPPSGRNRLDLDVFDLSLVFRPLEATPTVYSLTGTNAYTGTLAKNAGYTTELENVVDDPVALPYTLAIDNAAAGINTFNKFAMGYETTFNTYFNLAGMTSFNFDLFLTMGYGASAKKAQRLVPTYFNPEFNRKSAWKVVVKPPQGNDPPAFGNTWNDKNPSEVFNVEVKVYDWQHGVTTIANPPVNPDDIAFASNVSSVSVEIPGMTDTLPIVTTPASGTGAPDSPLVFQVPMANENLIAAGVYKGLVKVTDSRVPQPLPPDGATDYLIDAQASGLLENQVIPEFATYQVFDATVVVGCGPIIGSITSPTCPILNFANYGTQNFTVSASSGNGGEPIVLYEADWDYDGVTFSADANNTTGIFNNGGPFTVPNPCLSNIPYKYQIAFRATDSCVPPNKTIFATCNLTVNNCSEAVGNLTISVNRNSTTNAIDITIPWILSWTAANGAAEYAVYYDNDPADGLTNNLLFVGTTATTTFNAPASHFPANHRVKGLTYVVRTRGIAGNPSSETGPSEPAFILANGWDTLASGIRFGITPASDGEDWRSASLLASFTPVVAWMQNTYTGYQVSGTNSLGVISSGYIGWSATGSTMAVTIETPVVPNSTKRIIDFEAAFVNSWNNPASPNGGVIIGSCDDPQPYTSWSTVAAFHWASAYNTPGYTAYNWTFGSFPFSMTGSSGNNSWHWTATAPNLRCGGDLGTTYKYAGIAAYSEWGSTFYPIFCVDDLVIMIY